ncbi:hypothetical protein HII17_05055 [Thalassotalea sp. M1531]|uniref:Tetratricopeptide repeat protein n=1 Tax=Thalassotalea algicola TaxID=2716224 RepID=A0A7Y0LAM4_9GAMM|nr:hypothetical protein [Thalassotalea algicola]NMP30926.1 hypothetical protein [Thalassotalea algicola]
MRLILLVLMTLVVSGCSYQKLAEQPPAVSIPINHQIFDTTEVSVTSEAELFYLTPSQQSNFFAYFNKEISKGKLKHEAISDYLLKHLTNFSYYGETLAASQALGQEKGNCMSLAILTTALAKLVGVEYGYREVITLPVYKKQNNLILSSIHLQTKLFNPEPSDIVLKSVAGRSGILIDYFPNASNIKSRYLRYPQFIAMYYKNIASDALVEDQLSVAYANAMRAYHFDGGNPEVLNLMAVIHRRAGDEQTAEQIYQTARAIDEDNLSLLSNHITLLNSQQRQEEVLALRKQIDKLDDRNPYSWLEQAYVAHNQGKMRDAERYYKKTLELAPYVNQAYFGLYQVYMSKDQEHRAKATLAQALEWTHDNRERKQLKYKLYGRNIMLKANE